MADLFPQNLNVEGPTQLIQSRLNKQPTGLSADEGVAGEFEDQLTLKLEDEELLSLSDDWEANYMSYEGKILTRQEKNESYYLGKQGDVDGSGVAISSNLIFEAFETFLAAALAKNPEPVVYTDNSAEGTDIADAVKTMLQYHADMLAYRRKLTAIARSWGINFIGVMKYGWDKNINDITCEVRNPRNFIFDPNGFVDMYGDYDGPLGERITISAYKLINLFPEHKAYITLVVNGKLGTKVTYTEWWDDDYTFTTFKRKVLDKSKNPFFNYPSQEPSLDAMGQLQVGEDGEPVTQEQKGNNHFAKPKKPYTFLNVFSFQTQPHDVTGLIEQNIPNQNRITRRTDQIDRNLSRANNSIAFSENNFNQETAKQAAQAFEKGNPVIVPSGGPISEAITRFDAPGFSDSAFKSLEIDKQDLRSIFGTEGITSQPASEDTTARGMILNQQYDNTRIGGGIGDSLEQFADNSFNWFVQLYTVFYNEKHFAAIMGQLKAVEYVELSSQDLQRQLIVSVAPDSLKGHDELTEMNQAQTLAEQGIIDPKTLLTMLNFPDAQGSAEMGVLWQLDKQAYLQLNFPELAQQLQQMQQGQPQQSQPQPPSGASPPQGGQVPSEPPPTTAVAPAGAGLSQVLLPA